MMDRSRRKLNLGCGRDIRPAEEGWVNMDIAPLEGVDVVHDFLEFPWPLADQEFDEVYASHVLEHIPHRLGPPHKKDGFILFLEELHRIMRPSGILEVVCPHPESVDRWADPTHTRAVHPNNFSYFHPDNPFDYYSHARFRLLSTHVEGYSVVAPYFLQMGKSQLGLTTHLVNRLPFLRPLLVRRPLTLRMLVERV